MTVVQNNWQSGLIAHHQRLFGATGNPRVARGVPDMRLRLA